MPTYHVLRDGVYLAPVHKAGVLADLVDDRWRRDALPLEPVPLPVGTILADDDQLFEDLAPIISEDAEYTWDAAETEELAALAGDWRGLQPETGPDVPPGADEIGSRGDNPATGVGTNADNSSSRAIWASPAWRTTQQRQALLSQWSSMQPATLPRERGPNALAEVLWRRHRRTSGLDLNLEVTPPEPL
jgi:hypothetical protein